MPTLVQTPDLISPTISREQAIDRPVNRDGMSTFLQDILPAVSQGLDAYQKENKDHYIALGMNDELNNVTREVGFLDAHNYDQGKEFQKVTSTQAEAQKNFTETVTRMAREGKNADEIFDAGKDYLTGYTNSVYNSQLTPDLKEALYKAGIKENAIYQKLITKSLAAVKEEREQFDAQTRVSQTYQLVSSGLDPQETYDALEGHVQKAFAAKVAIGTDPKEAMNAAQNEISALFKFWNGQIDPSNPNASEQVNNLHRVLDVAAREGIVSMNTLNDIQGGMTQLRNGILEFNGVQAGNMLDDGMWQISSGQKQYDHSFTEQQLVAINDMETRKVITPARAAQLRQELRNFGESQYNKLLKGDLDPAQMVLNGVSLQEYIHLKGGGESEYSSQLERYYEGVNNGNPVASGQQMIEHGLRGDPHGERLTTLITKGTNKLSSQFLAFLSMPQDTAAKQPNYQNAQMAFNSLRDTYNKLRAQGSPLATDILAGIPDEQRGIVQNLFTSGSSMHGAAQALANPTQTNQKVTNVMEGTKAMTWENIGGDKWFGRGVGGGARIFKGTSEDVQSSYVNTMKMVYEDSKYELATSATNSSSELLVASGTKLGMHVKSPSGYNDALLTARAAKVYNNVQYKGVKLSADHIGTATDNIRTQIAKQANTDPSNVIVYSNASGSQLYVQAFKKDGSVQVDQQGRPFTVPFSQAQVIKEMQKVYDSNADRYKKSTSTFSMIGTAARETFSGKLIGDTINYKADQQQWRQAGQQTYQINKGSTIGNTVLNGNTRAQVPALTAVPFNGNVTLANTWMNFLNNYEGFKSTVGVVKGTGTDSDGLIIGNGINLYAHPQYKARAQAAQGNPQAILNLQAEFMADNMKDQQAVAKSLGIPVATNSPYNSRFTSAQILLADYKWHNGNYSTIKSIMSKPTYGEALAAMRKSAAYTHAGDDHRRNVARRNMLRDYYLAIGKL